MDKLLRGTIGSYVLGFMGEEQYFGIRLTFTCFKSIVLIAKKD